MLGVTIIVGLFSASYPSVFLSNLKPAQILKGKTNTSRKSGLFRKALIVIQFVVSIVMIIGVFTIMKQVKYLNNTHLGFDPRNVILMPLLDTSFNRSYPAFKKELLKHPEIMQVSTTTGLPGFANYMDVMHVSSEEGTVEQIITFYECTHGFLSLLGVQMVQGRDFFPQNITDYSGAVLVNENAAGKYGWEEDPLAQYIERGYSEKDRYQVIGVMQDFNFHTLHEQITPIVIFLSKEARGYLLIKLHKDKTQEAIKIIERYWKEFGVNIPFDYEMLDAALSEYYEPEKNLLNIIVYFTVLTLFLALLGLYCFSSFVAENFTREIGIRKAHGATSGDILLLLIKRFVYIVLAANIIAWPLAEVLTRNWLENFAYRIEVSLWMYILSAMLALLTAIITVGIQTYRSASQKPVDILKYE